MIRYKIDLDILFEEITYSDFSCSNSLYTNWGAYYTVSVGTKRSKTIYPYVGNHHNSILNYDDFHTYSLPIIYRMFHNNCSNNYEIINYEYYKKRSSLDTSDQIIVLYPPFHYANLTFRIRNYKGINKEKIGNSIAGDNNKKSPHFLCFPIHFNNNCNDNHYLIPNKGNHSSRHTRFQQRSNLTEDKKYKKTYLSEIKNSYVSI